MQKQKSKKKKDRKGSDNQNPKKFLTEALWQELQNYAR